MIIHPNYEVCGADTSLWNVRKQSGSTYVYGFDWDKFLASGLMFAINRAGIGLGTDPWYKESQNQCNIRSIPQAAYWYHYFTVSSAAMAQAAYTYIDADMQMFLDFERSASNPWPATDTRAALTQKMLDSLHAFDDKFKRFGYLHS